MGRKPKLNKEIQEKICIALRGGAYIETAAAFAGVSKVSLYNWLKLGARAERSNIYSKFANAVERAMASSEMSDLTTISKAAKNGNWQAAAWRLERKYPDRWGRYSKIDVTDKTPGANKKDQDLDMKGFTGADLRLIVEQGEAAQAVEEAKKIKK